MENKKNENRIVYAALILVLTVLAVLVIVTGVASRRARPNDLPEGTTGAANVIEPGTAEHDPNKPTLGEPSLPETDNKGQKPETDKKPPVTEKPETQEPSADVDSPSEPPSFSAPADGAVSKGHSETVLVYSMTMNDYRTHTGVDILAEVGSSVKAAAPGVISDVWEDPMWGWCVSISHEGDAVTVYKNLSRESADELAEGQEVAAGEIIGSVGDTALCELADEAHLHFEINIGGKPVDPEDYITFATADVFAE